MRLSSAECLSHVNNGLAAAFLRKTPENDFTELSEVLRGIGGRKKLLRVAIERHFPRPTVYDLMKINSKIAGSELAFPDFRSENTGLFPRLDICFFNHNGNVL